MNENDAKQATPREVLLEHLMNPNYAKTELEHYAANLVAQQQELIDKFRRIVAHATAEKTGVYFICGEGGPKDEMGLPEMILMCPAFGLDGMCRYVKSGDYSAPGY